ncbi:MAG: glutamine-hydrolyzing carbamoyl-phosphate synthase small subunit [Deltaproteobacteria bacterium]|nr:glutamine-hydrolyzing carbamoyl-phosphate synthase small subunit [Deltaproteobacteria bacterium]
MKKALLILSDGKQFIGAPFGSGGIAEGEIVFNTSMYGYQEILTDPSYKGQIITFTYPEIGIYGTNNADAEAERPHAAGFVVREGCGFPSNFRNSLNFEDLLKKYGIVGIKNVDTRALTLHIRDRGAMPGMIISPFEPDEKNLNEAREKAHALRGLVGIDLVKYVTAEKPYGWSEGFIFGESRPRAARKKVVAYDFGIKRNILRCLVEAGFEVTVVPAGFKAEDALSMKPDALFLSNGPGDPEAVTYAVENIRKLISKLPIFGICLGHQLLGLALGGRTFKLKFGHRGGNQPVKNIRDNRVEITAQNHGFCVDVESLPADTEVTHVNLNDGTLEGFECGKLGIMAVQYHPEASPGPHDSHYLFDRFYKMVEKPKIRA